MMSERTHEKTIGRLNVRRLAFSPLMVAVILFCFPKEARLFLFLLFDPLHLIAAIWVTVIRI